MVSSEVRKDFYLLISSRVCSRLGDGFLRILSVLLVAAKSKDPMIAGLVLVFRYICEILINAISGPFIDKLRIRTSLMASDLIRTVLSLLLIAAVLLGYPYQLYLVLSFLGDFVFIFFKPASDKVVKVSFPVEEGTKVLSQVDAANHMSNIGGYALASFMAGVAGLQAAVFLAPLFFFLSFILVFRLRLAGEKVIDYAKVRKKSYWASQKEGLRYTWANRPLRLLLIGRSLVAVGRGSFTVLSVVYLANIAKGLSAYGYFESAQSAGKVLVTALIIPFFFAYRSTFFLTGMSLLVIGFSFFGFNLVNDVVLACLVGALCRRRPGLGSGRDRRHHQPLLRRPHPGPGQVHHQLWKPPFRIGGHRGDLFFSYHHAYLGPDPFRLVGNLPPSRGRGLLLRLDK